MIMAVPTNKTAPLDLGSVLGHGATAGTIGPVGPIGGFSASQYWNNSNTVADSHLIQGKMYKAQYTVTDSISMAGSIDTDQIKMKLVNMLVQELWKDKAIEFTKIESSYDGNYKFLARIFVVPDTQVRILRENGK